MEKYFLHLFFEKFFGINHFSFAKLKRVSPFSRIQCIYIYAFDLLKCFEKLKFYIAKCQLIARGLQFVWVIIIRTGWLTRSRTLLHLRQIASSVHLIHCNHTHRLVSLKIIKISHSFHYLMCSQNAK